MLTPFFDQILYINLSHRTDRKEQLLSELEKMETDPSKITRIEAHYDPLHGHRGCAMSHYKALATCLEKGYKRPLILEDDFVFKVSKEELKSHLADFESLSDQWDVLMLGANLADYRATPHPNIIQVLSGQLAHAYAVSRDYIPVLKDCFSLAVYKMKEEVFYFEADQNGHLLDTLWKPLQYCGRWYMGRRSMGDQGASFSDINQVYLKRHTPLEYLGECDRTI